MNETIFWPTVCGSSSPFWDYNGAWNSTSPTLTDCFQESVLIWVPCAFLWLLAPLQLMSFARSRYQDVPWTVLNITKLVVCVLLFLTDFVALASHATGVFNLMEDDKLGSLSMSGSVVKASTMVLAFFLVVSGRRHGQISSGTLLFFWACYSLSGSASFYVTVTRLLDPGAYVVMSSFVLQMINFPLRLSMLMLTTLPDATPQYCKIGGDKRVLNKEESASLVSKAYFMWYDSMAWQGYRHTLTYDDIGALKYSMRSLAVVDVYSRARQKDVAKQTTRSEASKDLGGGGVSFLGAHHHQATYKPHLVRILAKAFGSGFVLVVLEKLVADAFSFLSPLVLSQLIDFVSNDEPEWHGYLFAVILFATTHAESLYQMHSFQNAHRLSLKMRSALMVSVYNKALRLSTRGRAKTTTGEIVNLMSIDITRTVSCVEWLVFAISTPVQVAIGLTETYLFLGPAAFVGLAIIVLLQLVSVFLARWITTLHKACLKLKDERIKLMNEVLTGIKVLKLLAWEVPFSGFVSEIRSKEIKLIRKIIVINGINSLLWETSSLTISIAAFAVFVLMNGTMDASKAFVSIAVFNILRRPLMQLPHLIATFVEASISVKRLSNFASSDEISEDAVQHPSDSVNGEILISGGCFSWGVNDFSTLSGINFLAPRGSLVAVVGQVGSGKSSLLSAILGEMNVLDGVVQVKGDVAYASQVPWIQNATLQSNVLFGKPMHSSNYDKVIDACALQSDLDILPAGDMTEIGERGINLSGGQKHRVSLARAVYHDADVYLLDDPLSAVDVHVGRHIFEHVVGPNGLLAKKTRILVTHATTYLPLVDVIVVMDGGTITEVGSYRDLVDRQGAFSDFIANFVPDTKEENSKDSDSLGTEEDPSAASSAFQRQLSRISNKASGKDDPKDGKLVLEENIVTEKEKGSIFVRYVRSFGFVAIIMLTSLICGQIGNAGSALWLSKWSNDATSKSTGDTTNTTTSSNKQTDNSMYLSVYALFGASYVFFMLGYTLALVTGAMTASRWLHTRMLDRVLRAPQWVFDVTPIGRILNRFSSDISVVDNPLSQALRVYLIFAAQATTMFLVILAEIPVMIVVAIPVFVFFYVLQMIEISSGRQLKRMDSVTRSPIYSFFSEVIVGAPVIRAFGREPLFLKDLMAKIDRNAHCSYLSMVALRWLNIKLELSGAIFLLFVGIFVVNNRQDIEPGTVGLVISYTVSTTNFLKVLFRHKSQFESDSISLERILEYCQLPQEAAWHCPREDMELWPATGTITMKDYETKYRAGLETVLKGVSCQIADKEKVGIVGRTGAGKSSMALSLLRIVEASGGAIVVDGVDIASIGLHDLRTKINVIPQDPVLFSGTLRRNLDPFQQHSDQTLWQTLELAHLKQFVVNFVEGIDYSVSEGGENLSVGQRQLVCLARSLLRKTKILILDEATAAVDLETDSIIQSTIRKHFADCTVLTVAHRLNTIMDSDKIMVLDKGKIIEYDSPKNLLRDKDSAFYRMARDANLL